MPTTTEDNLVVGDIYRPRSSSHIGFMTMVVVKKEDNGLITVYRPFCYGGDYNYSFGIEKFSFWANKNFEVDIIGKS